MKPLIAGIDPGTTSAIALIDFNGEIVHLTSDKHISTSQIIEIIIEQGNPIVVASDKEKTPSKVSKIARSLGAELYEPKQDLLQSKKSELGRGDNSHEVDASAAAFNAYNNLDKEVRKVKKISSEEDVTLLDAAQHYFKDRPLDETSEENEDTEEQSENTESEEALTNRLERKIVRLEKELERLRAEKGELEKEKENLKARIGDKRESIKKEVVKDEEIKKRESIIKEKNSKISELESSKDSYKDLVKAYNEALYMAYNNAEIIPKAEKVDDLREKVAVSSQELKEQLEGQGLNVKHVEEIKGIELKDFIVAEDFPEKNFEDIINDYRDSR